MNATVTSILGQNREAFEEGNYHGCIMLLQQKRNDPRYLFTAHPRCYRPIRRKCHVRESLPW